MLEYIVICAAALFASGLTLFSGFGLGTILMPVFAIFFHIEVAIALTAVVHLLNNLFKLALLGKYADKTAVLRFGFPAFLSAFLGAWVLLWFSQLEPLYVYQIGSRVLHVTPVKLVVAFLMVVFALFEVLPSLEKLAFDRKYLPLGGLLSGFFGGLSGHQGAMRSAFLLKCGLTKESFVATGVVIACMVDVSRLVGYGAHLSQVIDRTNFPLLTAAVLSAFLGAFIGNRLLKKITMRTIKIIVSFLLFSIALGLGLGII